MEATGVVARQIPDGRAPDVDAHRPRVVRVGVFTLETRGEPAGPRPAPRATARERLQRVRIVGFPDDVLRAAGLQRGPLHPRRWHGRRRCAPRPRMRRDGAPARRTTDAIFVTRDEPAESAGTAAAAAPEAVPAASLRVDVQRRVMVVVQGA